MFFVNYNIQEMILNAEGVELLETHNKVLHIRTKEAYEKILEQIEQTENAELIDHGVCTVIDPVPKADPFICSKCRIKEELQNILPFEEVQEPGEVKHEKIILPAEVIKEKKVKMPKAPKEPKKAKAPKEAKVPEAPQFSDIAKPEKVKKPKAEKAEKTDKPKKEAKGKKALKPVMKTPLK